MSPDPDKVKIGNEEYAELCDSTFLWHDFNNTICEKLGSPKEAVREANGKELLEEYDKLFVKSKIYEKKVYTNAGGAEHRAFATTRRTGRPIT